MLMLQELIDFSRKFISEEKNELFLKSLPNIESELMESLVLYSAEELDLGKIILSKEEKAGAYRIKEKLKKHIVNFNPKSKKHNASQIAFYKVHLNSLCVTFLISKQYRSSAMALAEKTFKLAEKFRFVDIGLKMARYLFFHYATFTEDKKLSQYYYDKVCSLNEMLNLEIKAEWYQSQLANEFSIKKELSPEFKVKSKKFYDELKLHFNEDGSNTFYRISNLVGVYHFLSIKDYAGCRKVCTEAIRQLTQRGESIDVFGASLFRNYYAYSCLASNMLEDAKEMLTQVLEHTEKNKAQWFSAIQYLFLIELRQSNYDYAKSLLDSALSSKALGRQTAPLRNRWKLFQAYYHLLAKLTMSSEEHSNSFKINKYINDAVLFSNDKKAMNVTLIICKYLFDLVNGKFDKMIDSEESLKSYAGRHLVKNKSFRNNCFIKMLLVISKQNFHPEAVARHSEKYRKKLAEVPLKFDGGSDLVEIIPFEQLWDLVLTYLMSRQKLENSRYEPLHPYLKKLASIPAHSFKKPKRSKLVKIKTSNA